MISTIKIYWWTINSVSYFTFLSLPSCFSRFQKTLSFFLTKSASV
nr:MAG TPA: hypothetical protein [Caudoviricetes sp.]